MEPKWKEGVYLGIRLESSEMLVGTEEGVFKCRSLRRKTEDARWNAQAVENMKGVPWKPYAFTEDDKLRVRLPQVPDDQEVEVKERKVDEDPAPRAFRIVKRDLITHGYTPYCPGCYAVVNLMSHMPHTPV